jgi:hypothetical protein
VLHVPETKVGPAIETLEKLTVVALAALLVAAQAMLSLDRELHFEGFIVKSHYAGIVLFAIIAGVNLQIIVLLQLIRNTLGEKTKDDVAIGQLADDLAGAEDPWSRFGRRLKDTLTAHLTSHAKELDDKPDARDARDALRTSRWVFNPYLETSQRLGFFTDTIGVVALMALWAAGIYMGRHFSPSPAWVNPAASKALSQCADTKARSLVAGWNVLHGRGTSPAITSLPAGSTVPALVDINLPDEPWYEEAPPEHTGKKKASDTNPKDDKQAPETRYIDLATTPGMNRETVLAALRFEIDEGTKEHKVPNTALRKLFRVALKGCERQVSPIPETPSYEFLATIVFCCYLLTVLVATSVILLTLRDVIVQTHLLRIKAGLVGAGLVIMMILGCYIGGEIRTPEDAEHGDFPITYKLPVGKDDTQPPPPPPPSPPSTGADDWNARLFRAIRLDLPDEADKALKPYDGLHADPTAKNTAGRSALVLAVELRRPEVVKHIVDALKNAGIPLSSQRDGDRTVLQIAAEEGSPKMLAALLPETEWSSHDRAVAAVTALNSGHENLVSSLVGSPATSADPIPAVIYIAEHAPELLRQFTLVRKLRPQAIKERKETVRDEVAHAWLEFHGYPVTPEGLQKMIAAMGRKGRLDADQVTSSPIAPIPDTYEIIELMLIASSQLSTLVPANGQPPVLQAAQQCDRRLVKLLETYGANDESLHNRHGEDAHTYMNRYCK